MNKTILILGASSDIGMEFILNNHDKYDKIICHFCHNRSGLDELRAEIGEKIKFVQGDFTDMDSVDLMMQSVLAISEDIQYVLHLPAPRVKNLRFNKIPLQSYIDGFSLQILTAVNVLQKILPMMSKNRFGKIVFLCTSYTSNTPPKYLSDYVTNKYALVGLTKALASEYADKQICINAVSPSMMDTKFLKNLPHFLIQQTAEESPMKRNASISDVCPMIQFLLSDESDYITGQNIVISGGE